MVMDNKYNNNNASNPSHSRNQVSDKFQTAVADTGNAQLEVAPSLLNGDINKTAENHNSHLVCIENNPSPQNLKDSI